MTAYDFLDVALKISLGALGILIIILLFMQIGYYIRVIRENIQERKREEAEKIAKNIYEE